MGRRKKKNTANNIKIFIVGAILTGLVGAGVYYGLKLWMPEKKLPGISEPSKPIVVPPEEPRQEQKPTAPSKVQEYVTIYYIGKNSNNEEVYRAVKRIYNKEADGSKLKCAINSLILGPKSDEKNSGVYSEIPVDTRLVSISETSEKAIINLSAEFGEGGGTESVYKRLYQLIKTAKRNTEKPVYLYINGQQADVIGGDGIMITQPLSETSLD